MLETDTANFVDATQTKWKVVRQKAPSTPVINQEVEVHKRRGKSNRIKKFILLRISSCILGWGQDLLHMSMTGFVKPSAYNH